jgi:hypothetical protein
MDGLTPLIVHCCNFIFCRGGVSPPQDRWQRIQGQGILASMAGEKTMLKWIILAVVWVFIFLVWHAHAIFEEDD